MTSIFFYCSIFASIVVALSGYHVYKSDYKEKRFLYLSLISASLTVLLYGFTVRCTNELFSYILNSFYLIFTIGLNISAILFYLSYCGLKNKFKLLKKILIGTAIIISLFIFSNIFTHKLFVLQRINMVFGDDALVVKRLPLYYVHYIYVCITGLLLVIYMIYNIIHEKGIYKLGHILLLFIYTMVINTNIILKVMNTYFDYSVFCYGMFSIIVSSIVIKYIPAAIIKNVNNIIITSMDDALFALDVDKNIIYKNEAAINLMKYYRYNVIENSIIDSYIDYDLDMKDDYKWDSVRKKGRNVRYFVNNYRKMYNKNNEYVGDYLIIHDKTESVLKEKSEKQLIYYDQLTGLYDRNIFEIKVGDLLEQINEDYYMIHFDIKNFKLINEFYGAKIGDSLLVSIADVLKKEFKDNELVIYSRLQGDKFAIFMPKYTYNNSGIYNKLNAVNKMVDSLNIYIYMGICPVDKNSKNVKELIDHAQLAGSICKHNLNDNIKVYDESIKDSIYEENKIVSSFDDAKKNGEFVFYIQPQISNDDKVLGGEALVRWIRDGKVVPPDNFIPLFEKYGLISDLDRYIWEEVCKKLKEWKERNIDYYISINLSLLDFFGMDIYKVLTNLVKKYKIESSKLKLEITESVFVNKVEELSKLIEKLKSFGFIIEMDDFGSGYSSLNMLKSIDIDVIKMDMGFLYDEDKSDKSRVILEELIKLSKKLNLEVITEGVETIDQVNYLKRVGCDIFQGYYFGKPMELKTFEKIYLEANNDK